jgi:hypothetical protein
MLVAVCFWLASENNACEFYLIDLLILTHAMTTVVCGAIWSKCLHSSLSISTYLLFGGEASGAPPLPSLPALIARRRTLRAAAASSSPPLPLPPLSPALLRSAILLELLIFFHAGPV